PRGDNASVTTPRGDNAGVSAPLLEVEKLTVRFGGLVAVNQVGFKVERGQIFAVIGPNGAGKTTVFNALTGIYEPSEGSIRFEGKELRRELEPLSLLRWLLGGLAVGIVMLLFFSNVDAMWAAVVKRNFKGRAQGF